MATKKTSGAVSKETPKAPDLTKVDVDITPEDVKSVSKVDYPALKSSISEENPFIVVTNTSTQPLVLDWNLDLLPEDIEEDFNKYLEDKYVQYDLKEITLETRIVAILQNGRTINFLNNYLNENNFPTMLSRSAGTESEVRSSFLLNAEDSVILTTKQADSLRRFEKIKRSWVNEGKKRETPWLGFLTMKTITDSKDLFKYDMSFVTVEDTKNTMRPLKEGKKVYTRRDSSVIREEE